MTDTATAPEAKTDEKPAKPVVQSSKCLCSTFQIVDPADKDNVFEPECGQTTKSKFAQGHDAKLVSFLVGGYIDGYGIQRIADGKPVLFQTPADAVRPVSEPLAKKAEAATENAKAKAAAKKAAKDDRETKKAARLQEAADRKAAAEKAKADKKAAAPAKNTGEVVAGSREGDETQLEFGQQIIKVGKFEYVATVGEDGSVTYIDGAGETQVRAAGDGYQVLRSHGAPAA